MINCKIDDIEFKLKEFQDFTWLNEYGKVFSVIDETGSGCICFGIEKDNKKYFYKIAGAKTVESEVTEQESINLLKKAVDNYKNIKHENLIKYIDSFERDDFFIIVFEFADGECLFDHWDFDKYNKMSKFNKMITPAMRFKALPIEKRLNVVDKLFSFFETVVDLGYVTVDFYDSSIIYDFHNDEVTFCDIDLFRKVPTHNDLGNYYFGSKRMKAPEENELNEIIDEKTCEFTLGAIIFDMFSNPTNIEERYLVGNFIPSDIFDFELSNKCYKVLLKATSYSKNNRYETIKEFHDEFLSAIK